ncbi:MAG: hypothetical protein JST21_02495 [Bacteroidetes bacterium]|nr:hypothetical protein [Bacteroidota bacterium]
MKPTLMTILSFVLLSLLSCHNATTDTTTSTNTVSASTVDTTVVPDSFTTKKIIENVGCKNDGGISYALYLPAASPAKGIIYFFDPHANGSLPLKKYQSLADAFHFILVGSNNSKNGNDFQTAENIWSNIFNDTQTRLHCDKNRVYVCGFSGGAKVAGYLALHHPEIKSVIAVGAGLPDGTPAASFGFSFTGIAGKGDMNMTDLVALNNDLGKTQTSHRIILFDGKHEWCPEAIMKIAFAGLDFDAMRNNTMAKNDSLINRFITNSKKSIEVAKQKNDYLQASYECILTMNILQNLADLSSISQQYNSIISTTAYKNQWQQQQQIFTHEQDLKTEYNRQFQQGDINYWDKVISGLAAKANGSSPAAQMNQRLLAYLSLAFYSISNQLINAGQNKDANFFVELYKKVDPDNSEAWYFSAIINARNNNSTATNDDLLKAVAKGFNDEKRMVQQPEFEALQPPLNMAAIGAKMKQ